MGPAAVAAASAAGSAAGASCSAAGSAASAAARGPASCRCAASSHRSTTCSGSSDDGALQKSREASLRNGLSPRIAFQRGLLQIHDLLWL